MIKSEIIVRICRQDNMTGPCADAGKPFLLAPSATGSFSEILPAALASGTPRALYYFVELENRNGQSAGLINSVATLAGAPPSPVRGLTARMSNGVVLLCWAPAKPGEEPDSTVIRAYRKFLTQGPEKQEQRQQTLQSKQPEQNSVLEFSPASGCTVDKNIRLGESYEYRAQRIARVNVKGSALELAGYLSEPVRIRTVTVFPPKTPE